MSRHHLVLGGARSGKSRFALRTAEAIGPRRRFVATAEAFDSEIADRIARHRQERGQGWETVETPRDLPGAIRDCPPDRIDVLLADCLTLWLSNILLDDRDPGSATDDLLGALASVRTPVVLVSNEVGMGLVPETPLGRAFRDAQGRLNQAVAEVCGVVVFVAAGLPLRLKGPKSAW